MGTVGRLLGQFRSLDERRLRVRGRSRNLGRPVWQTRAMAARALAEWRGGLVRMVRATLALHRLGGFLLWYWLACQSYFLRSVPSALHRSSAGGVQSQASCVPVLAALRTESPAVGPAEGLHRQRHRPELPNWLLQVKYPAFAQSGTRRDLRLRQSALPYRYLTPGRTSPRTGGRPGCSTSLRQRLHCLALAPGLWPILGLPSLVRRNFAWPVTSRVVGPSSSIRARSSISYSRVEPTGSLSRLETLNCRDIGAAPQLQDRARELRSNEIDCCT